MNLKKINKHIIDGLMGKESHKVNVGKTDDVVGITTDGFVLFIIKHEDFIFNYARLEKVKPFDVKHVFRYKEQTTSAKLTGDIKVINVKKNTKCVKLASENKTTWINEKFLTYFDKDCKFRLDEDVKDIPPVYVFKGDDMVGLIMAVRVNEGD